LHSKEVLFLHCFFFLPFSFVKAAKLHALLADNQTRLILIPPSLPLNSAAIGGFSEQCEKCILYGSEVIWLRILVLAHLDPKYATKTPRNQSIEKS
jgi:hypothetical protein